MRRKSDNSTSIVVKTPPIGVLTPLAELTAVLPKEAVTGIEQTKDPKRFVRPRAIISWLALIEVVEPAEDSSFLT